MCANGGNFVETMTNDELVYDGNVSSHLLGEKFISGIENAPRRQRDTVSREGRRVRNKQGTGLKSRVPFKLCA